MNSAFFVIDGTDGSGKATQTKMLIERLNSEGLAVETFSFPQYGQKSAGPTEEYLAGKYGSASEVNPYRGSVFYAVDRYDASFKIRKALAEGKVVVSDRYVGSNLGHQGGKISDPEERLKFFKWDDDFEHNFFGIPRPNVDIVLHVPAEVAQKLSNSSAKNGIAHDIHESNFQHLKDAENSYLEVVKVFDNFELVECMAGERYLSVEEVHQKVWQIVLKHLKPINTQQ
ncbi:MAG: thymidylate kinase [Candidatus Uhrbacteria bacterium]